MADAKQQFEKPAGTPAPASEPIIHVMPVEFRGGKSPMTKAPEEKKVEPSKVELPKPVTPPPSKPPITPVKKTRFSPLLIVGLVVLLLVGGGAAYVLLTLGPNEPEPVANTNVPSNNEPTNTPPTNTDPDPAPVTPTPVASNDADSDGLTDVEEVLFGSDSHDPDTDDDSYLDGNEVFHLYNPRGDAPGLLIDTGFARSFEEEGYSYTIVYPSRWEAAAGANDEVVFQAPTGEYIQVSHQTKELGVDIADWYARQHPELSPADIVVTQVITREGYVGIMSPDKLSTYLDFGDTVYVIHYNLGFASVVNFLTTYQMMVNAFHVNG